MPFFPCKPFQIDFWGILKYIIRPPLRNIGTDHFYDQVVIDNCNSCFGMKIYVKCFFFEILKH